MKLVAYDFKVVHMAGDKIPCDYGSRARCTKARVYTEEEKERYGVDKAVQ